MASLGVLAIAASFSVAQLTGIYSGDGETFILGVAPNAVYSIAGSKVTKLGEINPEEEFVGTDERSMPLIGTPGFRSPVPRKSYPFVYPPDFRISDLSYDLIGISKGVFFSRKDSRLTLDFISRRGESPLQRSVEIDLRDEGYLQDARTSRDATLALVLKGFAVERETLKISDGGVWLIDLDSGNADRIPLPPSPIGILQADFTSDGRVLVLKGAVSPKIEFADYGPIPERTTMGKLFLSDLRGENFTPIASLPLRPKSDYLAVRQDLAYVLTANGISKIKIPPAGALSPASHPPNQMQLRGGHNERKGGNEWSLKLEGASSVHYSRQSGEFIVSQGSTTTSDARLVRVSEESGEVSGTLPYLHAVKTTSTGWIGTDTDGAVVLYMSDAQLLRASKGGLSPTSAFELDGWPSVYGKWMVKAYASSLLLLNRDGPVSVLPGIGHSDTYGVDPDSGRIAGLTSGKNGLKLVFGDPKQPVKIRTLKVPRGTRDGYPDTSLEFLDKNHFVCILALGATGSYTDYRHVLAIIDLANRRVRPVCPFESELGHMMPARRNRIAVGRTRIAYLAHGGIVTVSISRAVGALRAGDGAWDATL